MTLEVSHTAQILRTAAFSAHKHRNQRRKDREASPYINHPIALADLLANEAGITDLEVICAALLHDTIEDTETSYEELVEHFGVSIADIVMEVTDDKSLDKATRKRLQVEHAPHISAKAKLVKMADKTCNLRDIANSPPHDWSNERKQDYVNWACVVVNAGLRGQNSTLDQLFDEISTRS